MKTKMVRVLVEEVRWVPPVRCPHCGESLLTDNSLHVTLYSGMECPGKVESTRTGVTVVIHDRYLPLRLADAEGLQCQHVACSNCDGEDLF